MGRFEWSRLNDLQLGRYAEYLAKMEFTNLGLSVFAAEVDDRGIDFVIRTQKAEHYDIQVKSSRDFNYVFCRKDKLRITKTVFVALVLFSEGEEPRIYLIPATVWRDPNRLFVSHDYPRRKSPPEYGINLSQRNLQSLQQYAFPKQAKRLLSS